jgi:uncharacterized membrane protein SirB2
MHRQERAGGKMSKKRILAILFLILLAISQASFAVHWAFFGAPWFEWLNFVIVTVAAIAIFEYRHRRFSWFSAVCGGFFLDIYSQRFFGFWILALVFLVMIIKFAVKKYVRIPSYW